MGSSRRQWSRWLLGLLRNWLLFGRLGSDDIDTSLEVSAVFNNDARGLDISHQLGILPNINLIGRFHVALNGAQDHDFSRLDSSNHFAVRSDRQAVLLHIDR